MFNLQNTLYPNRVYSFTGPRYAKVFRHFYGSALGSLYGKYSKVHTRTQLIYTASLNIVTSSRTAHHRHTKYTQCQRTHTNHTGQHSSTRYGEASCRSYLTKSLLARQITINDECLLEDSARLEQHARVLGGGLRAEVAVRVHLADCFLLNASLIAASVEGRRSAGRTARATRWWPLARQRGRPPQPRRAAAHPRVALGSAPAYPKAPRCSGAG